MMGRVAKLDLTGKRFGKLRVVRRAAERSPKHVHWLCVCDCLTPRVVRADDLDKKTPGFDRCVLCMRELRASRPAPFKRPDPVLTNKIDKALYAAWLRMMLRCYDPLHAPYPKYGGAGMTVCARWRTGKWFGFHNFLVDMKPSFKLGLSLNRIDNDRLESGYCPANCNWLTKKQQQQWKRNTSLHIIRGVMYSLSQLAKLTGIGIGELKSRLKAKWTIWHAIVEPYVRRGKVVYPRPLPA